MMDGNFHQTNVSVGIGILRVNAGDGLGDLGCEKRDKETGNRPGRPFATRAGRTGNSDWAATHENLVMPVTRSVKQAIQTDLLPEGTLKVSGSEPVEFKTLRKLR